MFILYIPVKILFLYQKFYIFPYIIVNSVCSFCTLT